MQVLLTVKSVPSGFTENFTVFKKTELAQVSQLLHSAYCQQHKAYGYQ
jgi:hypothetical protein